MTLDPEFNAMKIEKSDIKVGYNPESHLISIGTAQINNYFITVQLPLDTKGTASEIENRASEVALTVKGYFLMNPEQLKGLGSSTQLALVNATGTVTHNNIAFITTGTGSPKI